MIANQTIQPTQIAGFSQYFDDVNGTKAWLFGAGIDLNFGSGLYGGAEIYRRDLKTPGILPSGQKVVDDGDEQVYQGYLYWAVHPRWALSASMLYDSIKISSDAPLPRVQTWAVPLSIRYFDPLGFFASLGTTYVHQDVDENGSGFPQGNNQFVLLNAGLGYRLPQRLGFVTIEGRNLLGERFKFEDDSFRTRRNDERGSQYIPERMILGQLILIF